MKKKRTKKVAARRQPKRPLRTRAAARKRLKAPTVVQVRGVPESVVRFFRGVSHHAKLPLDTVINVFLAADVQARTERNE